MNGPALVTEIFTIGHSTHSFAAFAALLLQHDVTAVADVRSAPFSRRHPQFNKEGLQASLREHGIAYVFLGAELGARSKDPTCYENGRVQFARLAATPEFKSGIARVLAGSRSYRVALMCAEREPLFCHRTVLVARELERLGVSIIHIGGEGTLETHRAAMRRLLDMLSMAHADMFGSEDELIEQALQLQATKIAYVDPKTQRTNTT